MQVTAKYDYNHACASLSNDTLNDYGYDNNRSV